MPPPPGSGRPVAVVLVHYHTPDLAAEAVAAVLAEAGAAGWEVEGYLVDNGSSAAERERLAALPFALVEPGANLGYAGAINLGVERARADRLILMNPDVIVLPGCVPELLAALDRGTAVAGPRFFWDRGRRLELPPAESRDFLDEAAAALGRAGRAMAWARRRWRRHARAHWQAAAPLPSPALSGALLALTRTAWETAGPFDPGFRLYFEETDWLLRVHRRGLPTVFVPAARAVHLHAQSTAGESRAAWFEESAHRFRTLHHGRRGASVLERLGRGGRPPSLEALPPFPPGGLAVPAWEGAPWWVEVSPEPAGFPAAAERLEAGAAPWTLPPEIDRRLAPAVLRVALTDRRGREHGAWRLVCGEA